MDNIGIVDQIKKSMPFEFIELDRICDNPRCDNKITGVKYPNEEPRLMDHHNDKYNNGVMEYLIVKLTMCTPCMLKDNKKRNDRRIHFGTVQMIDYDEKVKAKKKTKESAL